MRLGKKIFSAVFFSLFAIILSVSGKTVKVSDYSPDKKDATAAIQKALDSGAETVIVDNPGFTYLVNPLDLRSNQTVIFEDGVVIQAIPGGFKNPSECLINGKNIKNVTLKGKGKVVLKMDKRAYRKPPYSKSPYRNLLDLRSCSNITVKNLTLKSSGGDGIYLAALKSNSLPPSTNILLEDLIVDDHDRQGLSIISARDVTVRNCTFSNTKGSAPMAGIDLEPNKTNENLSGIVIENCKFFGNDKGLAFNIHRRMTGEAPPIDVIVRNCQFYNNRQYAFMSSAGVAAAENAYKGNILVENCTFSDKKKPVVRLTGFRDDGVKITLKNCVINVPKSNKTTGLEISSGARRPLANINLDNLVINTPYPEKAVSIGKCVGGVKEITGNVKICSGKKTQKFDLTVLPQKHLPDWDTLNFVKAELDAENLVPAYSKGKAKPTSWTRGSFFLIHYGKAGVPVEIKCKSRHHGNDRDPKNTITVRDRNNNKIFSKVYKTKEYSIVFTPEKDGIYSVEFFTKALNQVASAAPGWGISTVGYSSSGSGITTIGGVAFFKCDGNYFITLDKMAEKASLKLSSGGNEFVGLKLYDGSKKLRHTFPVGSGGRIAYIPLKSGDDAKAWNLVLHDSVEDYSVTLGTPFLPILYTAPENILIRK